MKKKIDPKTYGLPQRTTLYQQDSDMFIISINRKSRIIMKDATAILEKVIKIKTVVENATVSLETNAPICSKSVKILNENEIEITRL